MYLPGILARMQITITKSRRGRSLANSLDIGTHSGVPWSAASQLQHHPSPRAVNPHLHCTVPYTTQNFNAFTAPISGQVMHLKHPWLVVNYFKTISDAVCDLLALYLTKSKMGGDVHRIREPHCYFLSNRTLSLTGKNQLKTEGDQTQIFQPFWD